MLLRQDQDKQPFHFYGREAERFWWWYTEQQVNIDLTDTATKEEIDEWLQKIEKVRSAAES